MKDTAVARECYKNKDFTEIDLIASDANRVDCLTNLLSNAESTSTINSGMLISYVEQGIVGTMPESSTFPSFTV